MAAPKVRVTLDGVTDTHAASTAFGYATLCRLAGDEASVQAASDFERITCTQCAQLFKAWRAYSAGDFSLKMRVRNSL